VQRDGGDAYWHILIHGTLRQTRPSTSVLSTRGRGKSSQLRLLPCERQIALLEFKIVLFRN
jgi:hypothetical protein